MVGDAEICLDDQTVISSVETVDAVSREEHAGTCMGSPAHEDRRCLSTWLDGWDPCRGASQSEGGFEHVVEQYVGHGTIIAQILSSAHSPIRCGGSPIWMRPNGTPYPDACSLVAQTQSRALVRGNRQHCVSRVPGDHI